MSLVRPSRRRGVGSGNEALEISPRRAAAHADRLVIWRAITGLIDASKSASVITVGEDASDPLNASAGANAHFLHVVGLRDGDT